MPEITLEALAQRLAALERTVSRLLPPETDPPGTIGDEQSDDPQAVAQWLAAFDAIPPITMTSEEEAAWRESRVAQKRADAIAFDEFVAGLPGSKK